MKLNLRNALLYLAIWLYILILITLKISPLVSTSNVQNVILSEIDTFTDLFNVIPFKNMLNYIINYKKFNFYTIFNNLCLNIVLFIPLGILCKFTFPSWEVKKIMFGGAFISLNIEIIKVLSITGYWNIDNILLNTLGFIIGAECVALLSKRNVK